MIKVNYNSKDKTTEICNLNEVAQKYDVDPYVIMRYTSMKNECIVKNTNTFYGIFSAEEIKNTCNKIKICFACRSRNVVIRNEENKWVKECVVCQRKELLFYSLLQ